MPTIPKAEIIDERAIDKALHTEICRGLVECFPEEASFFTDQRAWHGSAPFCSVVLREAGRVIAHTGVVDRTVRVGKNGVRVAGIQNVFVLRSHRGRDLSAVLLTAAMEEASARGMDLGLLFCIPQLEGVYKRAGWTQADDRNITCTCDGNDKPLPGNNIVMIYPLALQSLPDGPLHLQGNDW